jgi:hypothetical protein
MFDLLLEGVRDLIGDRFKMRPTSVVGYLGGDVHPVLAAFARLPLNVPVDLQGGLTIGTFRRLVLRRFHSAAILNIGFPSLSVDPYLNMSLSAVPAKVAGAAVNFC